MGVLAMLSPDTQDLDLLESSWCTLSTSYYRTGSRSYYLQSSQYVNIIIPGTTEGYLKTGFRNTGVSSGRWYLYDADDVVHLSIITTSTTIKIYRGTSTQLLTTYSYSQAISPGMNLIEAHWLIDDSSGVFQIKLDGNIVLDYSGDTKNAGVTTDISRIYFYANGNIFYLDDIVIRDDVWPGQGGVHVLVPNSGSALEDWTASAGNPEDCVDEIPPTFTDYISTNLATPDTEHLFNIEYLSFIPSEIKAVGVHAKMQSTEAASGNMIVMLKSGDVTGSGDPYAVLSGPSYAKAHYAVNPDGDTAWSSGDIYALQVGVKTV